MTTSMMTRIATLVPSELLSAGERDDLFDSFDLAEDLRRDREGGLPADLAQHPFRALKWTLLAAAAARLVADLQVELRDTRARLDARTRQAFADGGVARATEAMVAASIESDPSWHVAQRALHEAEAAARVCGDMCELLRQRWEALLEERSRAGGGRALFAGERRGATLGEAASLGVAGGARARSDRAP